MIDSLLCLLGGHLIRDLCMFARGDLMDVGDRLVFARVDLKDTDR